MVQDRHTVTTDHYCKLIQGLLNCAISNDCMWPSRSFPLLFSDRKSRRSNEGWHCWTL